MCPTRCIVYAPLVMLHRRSGASGFCLPLSGGADSSSTAAIVGAMCQMAVQEAAGGNLGVQADLQRYG